MIDGKFSIYSLDALHKLFIEQVQSDNKLFSINSTYLPNPFFTPKPKYCLIAMEPSLAGMTTEVFKDWVNRGFLNFLYSEGDFILHYCTYRFLCNDKFNYQITDISKGAMNTALANQQRNVRYANWKNLLGQELEFFGKPKLIAVGSRAKEFLEKFDLGVHFSIMHYSQNNCVRFRNYYEQHAQKNLADNLNLKLKEFAEKVLAKATYTREMRDSITNKLFNKDLSVWKKGLFLNYMDKFNFEREQSFKDA